MNFSLILNLNVKFRAFGITFGAASVHQDLAAFTPSNQPILAAFLENGVVDKLLNGAKSKVVSSYC